MPRHRSFVATGVAIGFAIVACVGCRTANGPKPRGTERASSGTSQNAGGLHFDPQGADFTTWVNHFRVEVYRNWLVPQPALKGVKGRVDLEFTVERDGSMTNLRLLKSSGTTELDRAAQNALQGSRFLPLPSDYGPPRVTMRVSFFYNEGPHWFKP